MPPNTEKSTEPDQPPTIAPSEKTQSGKTKQQPPEPAQPARDAPNLRSPLLLRHALQEALKELGHEL
jgi:hypothetical protein